MEGVNIFKHTKKRTVNPEIYSANIFFRNEGEIKVILTEEKLRESVSSRLLRKKWLKEVLWTQEK